MKERNLRSSLRDGDYIYGTAMVSQCNLWPGILSAAGMDFVFIDTEHTPLDRETVSDLCLLYKGAGIEPLVRIPSPDPFSVTMTLDGGATGIIVPYVESAEQVRHMVGAVKYRPLKGEKLARILRKEENIDEDLQAYLERYNEDKVLVVNIESTPALDSLDDILSVEGLDGVLIGPHDLSCSLGIPEQYDHPLLIDTVEDIIKRCRSKYIGVGVYVWDAVGFDQELKWAKKGANLIIHGSDLSLFSSALRDGLKKLRSGLGESTHHIKDSKRIL